MHTAMKYTVLAAIPLLYSLTPISGKSAIKTLNGDDTDGMEIRSVQVEGFETEPWTAVVSPGDPEAIPAVVDAQGTPMQGEKWNSPEVGLKGTTAAKCRPQNLAYD